MYFIFIEWLLFRPFVLITLCKCTYCLLALFPVECIRVLFVSTYVVHFLGNQTFIGAAGVCLLFLYMIWIDRFSLEWFFFSMGFCPFLPLRFIFFFFFDCISNVDSFKTNLLACASWFVIILNSKDFKPDNGRGRMSWQIKCLKSVN